MRARFPELSRTDRSVSHQLTNILTTRYIDFVTLNLNVSVSLICAQRGFTVSQTKAFIFWFICSNVVELGELSVFMH